MSAEGVTKSYGPVKALDRIDLHVDAGEFVALLGRHVGSRIDADAVCGIDQQRLHALCRDLTHGTVVVTLGSSGCFVSHAESNLRGDATACYRVPAETVRAVGELLRQGKIRYFGV